MTRDEFLKRLSRGLRGMPQAALADIVGDYEAHFEAAAAEGRSDREVAAALGDPARLARELKLEAGIRRWQESRSPSSAWAAVVAFIGLGALDIIILLPLLISLIGVLIAFYVAVIAVFVAGAVVMIAGPFAGVSPTGAVGVALGGLGIMAMAITLGSLLLIVSVGLVNLLLWFGRLHYRVLQPAIEQNA